MSKARRGIGPSQNEMKTCLIWVDYLPPSPNKTRYEHWSTARKHVLNAKAAWLSSLRSSDAGLKNLMEITSKLHSKGCAMLSPEALELTTETGASDGSTSNASGLEGTGPS